MTMNEPQVAAFAGHHAGVHAPGVRDLAAAVNAAHVLLLAHARAAQACREAAGARLRIGIALNLHPVYADRDADADEEAARMADAQANRWYLDPLLRGVYPGDLLAAYGRAGAAPRIEPDDLPFIAAQRPDFIGVNYYFPLRVRADSKERMLGFAVAAPRGVETTEMGWEIHPRGLSDVLARLRKDYDDPAVMITENGAAFADATVEDGRIQDDDRIRYLAGHLGELCSAMAAGARVEAYFLWSLLDNFEWAQGYSKRARARAAPLPGELAPRPHPGASGPGSRSPALLRAAEVQPDSAEAHGFLADALQSLGRASEAERERAKASALRGGPAR